MIARPADTNYVSISQATTKCGYALKFKLEHAPEGPPNIDLLIGRSVHAGIEAKVAQGADVEGAVRIAYAELRFNLEQHGVQAESGVELDPASVADKVVFERPHRISKKGEVYTKDRGSAPTLEHAALIVEHEVRAWCKRFPAISVSDPQRIERKEYLDIGQGRVVPMVFDIEPDEGGCLDIKTANEPWAVLTREDGSILTLDPEGKQADKADQAQLYQHGQAILTGEPFEFFAFHVIPHTGLKLKIVDGEPEPCRSCATTGVVDSIENGEHVALNCPDCGGGGGIATKRVEVIGYDEKAIQVIPVAYDPDYAERVIEHKIRRTAEAKEQGVFVPNTSGWWHSAKYCSYWNTCPLGAAAHGGAA